MSRVRSKDTRPELRVRSLVHRLGYRFRLHRPDIPGRPDLAFVGRRKVVFVHGCFWHRHDCPLGRRVPKSRLDFWVSKFQANVSRDRVTQARLASEGWLQLVIWECETRDDKLVADRLRGFLDA